MKFGVVRFPGSCDDVDALLAALPAALERARRAGQVRIDARMAAAVRGGA